MNYKIHFALLALASVVLVCLLEVWPVFAVPRNSHLVMYGVLHALAVLGALPGVKAVKGAVFVALAAGLSVAAVYGGTLLAGLLGGAAFAMMFALASGLGAVSYAVLIRKLWLSDLSLGAIGRIALGCIAATFTALFVGGLLGLFHESLTIFWWLGFSVGLWLSSRRAANKPMQATCEDARA